MGIMVSTKCPCGFTKELLALFGWDAVDTGRKGPRYRLMPAYCEHCCDIVTVDSIVRGKKCEKCGGKVIWYGRNKIVSPMKNSPLSFRQPPEVSLFALDSPMACKYDYFHGTSDGHLCPRCLNYTLSFSNSGCWD